MRVLLPLVALLPGCDGDVTGSGPDPVASLVVWPADTVRAIQGRVIPLLVEMRDSAGEAISHPVQITSSDPARVGVAGGVVTALATGRATLTVRAGTRSVSLPVEVVSGAGYTARSLGSFRPRGLNNAGWIVGQQDGRPALWRNGEVTRLPTDGLTADSAYAVNDSGVVAGAGIDVATGSRVLWTWRDGALRRIPLGAPPGASQALTAVAVSDLNDRGEIVGSADTGGERPQRFGFRWDGSRVEWLPAGFAPAAINAAGTMVGMLGVPSTVYQGGAEYRAALYDGAVREIPAPPGNSGWWWGSDINDRGEYVGIYNGGCYSGFFGQGVTVPSGPPGGFCSAFVAVNDYAEILGYYTRSGISSTPATVLRSGATLLMTVPERPGVGSYGVALNDPGQVIVRLADASAEPFLMTPSN